MLIALAHGSRNPEWRASVERQIGSLQDELGHEVVQLAYMDHSPPTLMDIVEAAVQGGITHIRVLPLFLAAEGHVTKDIEPMVKRVRDAVGLTNLELLPPIGQHRAFRGLLLTLASQTSPEVD